MNRRSKYLNNHGYTLIEIVMVIVILGVIGAFTFQFVAHGVQAFKKSSARKDLYDQGRLALERMVRELRDAKQVIGSSTDTVTFKKAHPQQAADYIEEIKFQLNGTNLERVGNPSGTPVTAVLASNVSGFSVTGLASGGGGGSVPCTIAIDSQSSGFTGGASSVNFVHTIGGSSNRILVVGVSVETCNPYETVSSVTYGGQALTFFNSAEVTSSNACRGRVELYYLLEADIPGAGPFNVLVTATGSCDALAAGAISLTGVAQQAPEASNTNANDAQTTISTNITTLTDGAWLVDVVHSGNSGTFTANSGQSVRYDQSSSTSEVAGSTLLVASAGNASLGWTNTSANRLAHAVAAFAPATGCSTGGGADTNWGIDQQGTSSTTSSHSRAMGGTSPNEDGMEIQSISMYLGAQTGDVRLAVYTGGALDDPQSATLLWDAGTVNPNGVAGWYTVNHPTGLSWPKNTVTWLAWKRDTSVALYYSDSSSDAGNFQTARGRNNNNFSQSPSVAFPSTYGDTGSFSNYWYSIYVAYKLTSAIVTLELTLTDPNDSGNTVTMRTKVFMRNMQ